MKRSLFLSLAAGLVASLALAAPSHAGSVTVTGTWSVPGATATELDFFFSGPVTAIDSFSGAPAPNAPTIVPPPPNEVVFTYTPGVVGGALKFTVETSGVLLSGEINPASIVGTPSSVNFNFTPTGAVPEPASIALLGIGMTGFLAFRRLFKRPSVA
jgi:PEP-CTERM motif